MSKVKVQKKPIERIGKTIIQIIPASGGIMAKYKDYELYEVVCWALVQESNFTYVIGMLCQQETRCLVFVDEMDDFEEYEYKTAG